MLKQLTDWLQSLAKSFFESLWTFIVDVVSFVLDAVLGVFVALVNAIPVPSFMSGGLQAVYGQLDPAIGYVLTASGLPQALGIIGAAYVFRLGRKVATLFQW